MSNFCKDIEYQKGFKYQETTERSIQTDILGFNIDEKFFKLTPDGILTVKIGYSWDGASKCPDINSILRGSLFHDVLYQMMRMKLMAREHRKKADQILEELCIEDGMWKWFAHYVVYKAVRKFGASATHPNNKRQILTAP